MGSCVSRHKNSESAIKLPCSVGSKAKDNVLIESPIKESTVNVDQLKPQPSSVANRTTFGDLGSEDENFFDSQPWLESDCEDFFSVNGDFTPSWGNTPIHQSSFIQTPQLDDSLSTDRRPSSISEPSPTDTKKKLSDLLRESFSENQVDELNFQGPKTIIANRKPEGNHKVLDLHTIPTNGTSHMSNANSIFSNEMTPERVPKLEEQKFSRSVSCCLPSLARSLSLGEKKKRLSPPHSFGR